MKRHLFFVIALLLITHIVQAQQTTHLQGRVYLNDTLPAAYATLYLPQYGIGTVTDDQGQYWMDNIPVGNGIILEFAHLGYKTDQVRLSLTESNHRYAHDHHMQEQAIQLAEVYLTPNGEDPCTYIMRKKFEQGQINRKRLITYQAVCNGSLHVQDVDLIMALLPGFVKTMLHGALRTVGMNALFNYIADNPKVDVSYLYEQSWNNGKVKNSDLKITSASPTIPEKARKQLSKFQTDSFFDLFYGSGKKFDAEKVKKQGWKLKGVIEENGQTIDVLARTEGDSIKREYTAYIIEDLWSVLRFEMHSNNGGFSRFECRDVGGGIYLPISYVTKPIPLNLDKSLQELFDDVRSENVTDSTMTAKQQAKKQKEAAKDEKKIKEMEQRYEKAKKGRKQASLNIITPYNIRYSGVVVK